MEEDSLLFRRFHRSVVVVATLALFIVLVVPAVHATEETDDLAATAEPAAEEVEPAPAEETEPASVEEPAEAPSEETVEAPAEEMDVVEDAAGEEAAGEETDVVEAEPVAEEPADEAATEEAGAADDDASATSARTPPDPKGNNGTVKVDSIAWDSHPNNEPHQSCSFYISWHGYDEGQTLMSTYEFTAHPPTGSGETLASGSVFIGEDAAGGANDLDHSEGPITLDFTGFTPHAVQGYHVKLTVHADGSQGADTKHKVFWVQPCETEEPPPSGLIVEKQTIGGDDDFEFSGQAILAQASIPVSPTLSDDESEFFFVDPGSYTVEELLSTQQAEDGWSLIDISCEDDYSLVAVSSITTPSSGDVATATATFNVDPGETVKCIFTNELDEPDEPEPPIDNNPPEEEEPPVVLPNRFDRPNSPDVGPSVLGAPLPFTGMNAGVFTGIGLMMIVAGAASLVVARARRKYSFIE
jgi:hypothetical protein